MTRDLGVYAFAHKIGFAVNTLCLLPFSSIWQVAIYDINRQKNTDEVFTQVFGWFVSGLGILLLGAALTVHPVLPLLTPDAFGPAVELIAVMLLALFVYGLQIQFEVPALLAKRTGLLVPGSIAGVITNLTCNSAACSGTGPVGCGMVRRGHVRGLFVYDAVAVSQSASAGVSVATESGRSGWLMRQLCRRPVLCVSASGIHWSTPGIDCLLWDLGDSAAGKRWHLLVAIAASSGRIADMS